VRQGKSGTYMMYITRQTSKRGLVYVVINARFNNNSATEKRSWKIEQSCSTLTYIPADLSHYVIHFTAFLHVHLTSM